MGEITPKNEGFTWVPMVFIGFAAFRLHPEKVQVGKGKNGRNRWGNPKLREISTTENNPGSPSQPNFAPW